MDQEGFIKITVNQDSEFTTISVTDNGSGIDKENLERVFDKFFQEDYNKSGSGLGLAISNEIVKLHNGEMSIESKKNVGTSITFTLKNKLINNINKSGSGLGLAISNEIVKLHNGEMSIESKKNVGTSITFTLKNKLINNI